MDAVTLRQYETLSPFEIKNDLAAIQEAAHNPVPTLWYGVAYAVGNVLLALWGTVIVALL